MPTSPVALANGRANPAFGQFNRPSVRVADRPSELSRKTDAGLRALPSRAVRRRSRAGQANRPQVLECYDFTESMPLEQVLSYPVCGEA